jgi:hypothetical protein
MRRGLRVVAVLAVAASAYAVSPQAAYAYIDGGDEACGCTAAGWNAPNGALISSRSRGGPVTGVIDAIGEYYTHSMISHGPGSTKWVSQTTMRTPGIYVNPFGDDQVATDELRYGYPGPAQVNMGAVYKMLYSGTLDALKYTDGGTTGPQVADYLWYTLPSCSSVSSGLCYVGVYSLQQDDYSYSTEYLYIIGRKLNGRIVTRTASTST